MIGSSRLANSSRQRRAYQRNFGQLSSQPNQYRGPLGDWLCYKVQSGHAKSKDLGLKTRVGRTIGYKRIYIRRCDGLASGVKLMLPIRGTILVSSNTHRQSLWKGLRIGRDENPNEKRRTSGIFSPIDSLQNCFTTLVTIHIAIVKLGTMPGKRCCRFVPFGLGWTITVIAASFLSLGLGIGCSQMRNEIGEAIWFSWIYGCGICGCGIYGRGDPNKLATIATQHIIDDSTRTAMLMLPGRSTIWVSSSTHWPSSWKPLRLWRDENPNPCIRNHTALMDIYAGGEAHVFPTLPRGSGNKKASASHLRGTVWSKTLQ